MSFGRNGMEKLLRVMENTVSGEGCQKTLDYRSMLLEAMVIIEELCGDDQNQCGQLMAVIADEVALDLSAIEESFKQL